MVTLHEIVHVLGDRKIDVPVIFVPLPGHFIEWLNEEFLVDPVLRIVGVRGADVLLRTFDVQAAAKLGGDRSEVHRTVAGREFVHEHERGFVAADAKLKLRGVRRRNEDHAGPSAELILDPHQFVVLAVVHDIGEMQAHPFVEQVSVTVAVAVSPSRQNQFLQLRPCATFVGHRANGYTDQRHRVAV